MPGLLEDEFLQSRRLGVAEVAQLEVAGDGLLVLGDGLLAFPVELYQARVNSQLRRAEAHQLVGHLEWLLFREPIEQTDEGNLVGEAEPIVGAPALANLLQVFFGQRSGAFELLAGEHLFVYTPAINFNLWPAIRRALEPLQNQGFQQPLQGGVFGQEGYPEPDSTPESRRMTNRRSHCRSPQCAIMSPSAAGKSPWRSRISVRAQRCGPNGKS